MRRARLNAGDAELIRRALEVRRNAHAPYSRFAVGAAVRCADGTIFTGCNVENASYGATVCAERNAIAAAVAAGKRDFLALAIATVNAPPAAPCGLCRQVISEFSPDLRLLLCNPRGDIMRTSLGRLLPLQFSRRDL
ncbi:MAG: cytidine deaminase [Myxococcales bacterium]|nr:cytidine deaminase [Myxococcales bacterium]